MDASTTAVQQAYAAWIQAIGSITGIGVTVYIFWRQSAFLRREANQQKISLLESVLGILQDVELSLEEAAQFWETARNPRTPLLATKRIRLGQALAALNELPLHEIQPYAAMSAFLECKRIISKVIVWMAEDHGAIYVNERLVSDIRDWAGEIAEQRAVLVAQSRQLSQ